MNDGEGTNNFPNIRKYSKYFQDLSLVARRTCLIYKKNGREKPHVIVPFSRGIIYGDENYNNFSVNILENFSPLDILGSNLYLFARRVEKIKTYVYVD
jgi:hypothetical protein